MFKHLIHDGYSFYGITDTGALLWYRDINNNGTVGWAPASGKQIGVGWGKFIRIFPGSDPGEIYAVEPSGNLFGLSQDAGMGWEPSRLLDPEFLILSTHGGLRASCFDYPEDRYRLLINIRWRQGSERVAFPNSADS